MKPNFDQQFAESHAERQERQARRRKAMQACFRDCDAGVHLDPENGCVSKCESWEYCQGYRAYLNTSEEDK